MHVRSGVNGWTLSSKLVLAGTLLSSLVAVPQALYKSGSVLHFDGAIQQILPAGSGFLTLGVEGFYFDQVTCDSGAGATLGCFKGMTAGLGPVLGYIQPLGKESVAVELKWLTELDTKNRLQGDYVWLKLVYKF
jgi:hypothetical protein